MSLDKLGQFLEDTILKIHFDILAKALLVAGTTGVGSGILLLGGKVLSDEVIKFTSKDILIAHLVALGVIGISSIMLSGLHLTPMQKVERKEAELRLKELNDTG